MTRHPSRRAALPAIFCLAALGPASPATFAQIAPAPSGKTTLKSSPAPVPAKPAESPVSSLQSALKANPITAPYRIGVTTKNGRVLLSGRVGSKSVYDAAVRTAIDSGIPFTERLVIDTSLERALARAQGAPVSTYMVPPAFAFGFGYGPGLAYPSPLLGPYDAPQVFDPPVIAYPPYWQELSERRLAEDEPASTVPLAGPNGTNTVEATIDPLGVATLRGTVATMEERIGVGQKLAKSPGVTEVINLLNVDPTMNGGSSADGPAPGSDEVPPPPPIPIPPPEPAPAAKVREPEFRVPDELEPADTAPAIPTGSLEEKLKASLAKRPALDGLTVRATVDDGVATLKGTVPSAYEAMLAHRTAQQMPGIRSVNDQLKFQVPDDEHPNPLREKGRTEDVEPYLQAQIRRQLGDLAHLDRTHLSGDELELTIQVGPGDDRERVEAILRSMPLLRGFRVEPRIIAQDPGN